MYNELIERSLLSESIKTYTLVIDNSIMQEYGSYYKTLHPKSKKHPFAHKTKSGKYILDPIPPSINKWMIMKRLMMNAEKQKWKDFIIWYIYKLGYTNLNISKCRLILIYYFSNARDMDLDNRTPKNILDGFTASKFLKDDNYKILNPLIIIGAGIDKENPRVEFIFEVIK